MLDDDARLLYELAPAETIKLAIDELNREFDEESQNNNINALTNFEEVRAFNDRIQRLHEDIMSLRRIYYRKMNKKPPISLRYPDWRNPIADDGESISEAADTAC